MPGFRQTVNSDVSLWTGDPDCDGAHAALLGGLQRLSVPFIGAGETITDIQRGNLGEFAVFQIGCSAQFAGMEKFAQNALQPLSGISGSGLDLTYVYFDNQSEQNDLLFIQEVKTTCADDLNYFDRLTSDYRKLFSNKINFSLQTRIQCLANSFELERNRDDYADRVQKLAATTPQQCSRVRLIPTGVHGLHVGNPVQKMLAIRSAITTFGWSPRSISPWTFALSDLEDRLLRLARGRS